MERISVRSISPISHSLTRQGQASPAFRQIGESGSRAVLIDKEAFLLCLDWEFKR